MILDAVAGVLIVAGSLFCLIGGIGIVRMPDLFTRIHAASITDTLGVALVLVGLTLHGGFSLVTVKLFMILGFLWLTGPAASHALGKAALGSGIEPLLDPEDGP